MLNKLLDINDLDIHNNWGEYFTYLAGIVGFMISLVYFNLLFNLISIFVLGFVAARIHFFKSKEVPILPFSLMFFSLFMGILVGSMLRGTVFLIIPLFLISFYWSYCLHNKNILGIFKSKDFIK